MHSLLAGSLFEVFTIKVNLIKKTLKDSILWLYDIETEKKIVQVLGSSKSKLSRKFISRRVYVCALLYLSISISQSNTIGNLESASNGMVKLYLVGFGGVSQGEKLKI